MDYVLRYYPSTHVLKLGFTEKEAADITEAVYRLVAIRLNNHMKWNQPRVHMVDFLIVLSADDIGKNRMSELIKSGIFFQQSYDQIKIRLYRPIGMHRWCWSMNCKIDLEKSKEALAFLDGLLPRFDLYTKKYFAGLHDGDSDMVGQDICTDINQPLEYCLIRNLSNDLRYLKNL